MLRIVALLSFASLLFALTVGCSDPVAGSTDAAIPHGDGGSADSGGTDPGDGDGGGTGDAGSTDAEGADAASPDAETVDAAQDEVGTDDAGVDDAGEADAGQPGDDGGWGGDGEDGGADAGPNGCNGSDSIISGTTLAPNGIDPIPYVLVYVTHNSTTFPSKAATVTCDACAKPKNPVAMTISGPGGTFALSGVTLDLGGTFTVVMDTGSFRRVIRNVSVGVCKPLALTAAQTRFSGDTVVEDIAPRIVVASDPSGKADVNDKLVNVLDTIGVSYDTVLPDRTGGQVNGDLLGLMASPAKLAGYDIVAIPCGVLGNYTVGSMITTTAAANLTAWLKAGGRLYSSDLAYEVVAQADPAGFTWAPGPSPHAGADHGDSGVGLAKLTPPLTSIDATVDNPDLLAWLQAIKVVTAPATTNPVVELRDPWGAVDAITTQTDARGMPLGLSFVSASVSWWVNTTTIGPGAVHPLTAQVDVQDDNGKRCGRIAYTSYHMQSSSAGGSLSPQERVLEYLLFQLSRCVTVD